jgi:DNA-binding beta-propeller fold protein YncE
MATQEEFLELVWAHINRTMEELWIDGVIPHGEQDANDPFAEVGRAVQRLLALGASRRDLSLLVRHGAFDEAMSTLYLLSDPGIDDNDVDMLHTQFIDADPNGMAGCLGPAPQKQTAREAEASSEKPTASAATKPKAEKRKLIKWSADASFSPDGTLLATVGMGLTLWKCPEIERLTKISNVSNPSSVAFSPDSRLLAVKSTSGRIALIDAVTQTVKLDFRNQADGEGSNVVFADDGAHVVDGSWAGFHTVRTLDGKLSFREVFEGTTRSVKAVLRHPDGRYWFRRGERLLGRTWPFRTGEYEEVLIPGDKYYRDVVFSPDGQLLAVVGGARVITVLSFPSMKVLRSIQVPKCSTSGLSFSPCGRLIAVVGEPVVVLDSTTLAVIAELRVNHPQRVCFSPSAPLMAVGGSPGEVFDTTPFLNARQGK